MKPKNPLQKLRRFFVRSRTFNAAAIKSLGYDDELPTTRLSGAFIVVLLLHFIAIVGVFAFASLKTSQNSLNSNTQIAAHPFHMPLDLTNNIIAPLAVAGLTGCATWIIAQLRFQRRVDAAPRQYIQHLDSLISRAATEGIPQAIVNARSIVAARNTLRSSLLSISKYLNSEIDRLSKEIGEPFEQIEMRGAEAGRPVLEPDEAYQTIQVLARIWPSKKTQIEVEIRKLLAELGLSPTFERSNRSSES